MTFVKRCLFIGAYLLIGVFAASCAQEQIFTTITKMPPANNGDWHTINPDGIDVTSLAVSPTFSSDETIFIGLRGWDLPFAPV